MCLVVDLREHPTLAPKIAEEDIEVLKILKVIHNDEFYQKALSSEFALPYIRWLSKYYFETPFQELPINFDGDGVCCLREPDFRDDAYSYEKRLGIHALTKKPEGATLLEGLYYFKAVIPKGTLYYKGMHDDIVSEEMKIYQYCV